MTTWFTADTHFGSKRTLELSRRPFTSTEEMDAEIMKHWLELFKPGDVLFHLGDFGEMEVPMKLLDSLGVTCHLVLGNYEEDALEKGELTYDKLESLGFATVSHCRHDIEKGLKLGHRPEDCDKESGVFNLFGHIHGRQTVKRYGIDVGVDAHHFRPISLVDAMWYKNAIENHYDDNVFE